MHSGHTTAHSSPRWEAEAQHWSHGLREASHDKDSREHLFHELRIEAKPFFISA
jgi:hypothetical protein